MTIYVKELRHERREPSQNLPLELRRGKTQLRQSVNRVMASRFNFRYLTYDECFGGRFGGILLGHDGGKGR